MDTNITNFFIRVIRVHSWLNNWQLSGGSPVRGRHCPRNGRSNAECTMHNAKSMSPELRSSVVA